MAVYQTGRRLVLLCRTLATGEQRYARGLTILTTEPGPEVAPIHNRQVVVLERADWAAWLDLTRPEAELLRALPMGSLQVEQVR